MKRLTSNHSLLTTTTGILLACGTLLLSCQNKPKDKRDLTPDSPYVAGYGGGDNARIGAVPIAFDTAKARLHVIPISLASTMTANFRTARKTLVSKLLDTAYLTSSFNLANAEMFNRDAIALLLNVPNAAGIRIYHGKDNSGLIRFVLVPVDANGNDIITTLLPKTIKTVAMNDADSAGAAARGEIEGEAVESGQRCPSTCSFSGPL
ncbi:hypothetical protein KTO58_05190 [Chitinophaga pendula]|uniref:hypothetical protein n=1 Tax=Chitinophaga TaxID=79328 RepID=UPI000BB0C3B7|nr:MULTISPECIES: hypothetical protein [Chitinophaga]ASZ13794.1 hypothetical protein CK934_23980 [Chitinophaga sp. MD30]UCJ08587.1 hypothetical protein KTO58_05190 [Chitinophaga pendula]